MLKSSNYVTNLYLKELEKERTDLDLYVQEVQTRDFVSFSETDDFMSVFSNNMDGFNYDDLDVLRNYTGYNYKRINSLLRGITSSDEIGYISQEDASVLTMLGEDISKVIQKHSSLPSNIVVYRGTTIDQFKQFGITSLEDLIRLKGEFMFEPSFTSTSLLKDNSFFKSESDYHDVCDIEIEYLIPEESNCGIPLVGYDMSYSNNQFEYLIDKGTVTKVVDVNYDESGFAHLKAVHIPKNVWNKSYTDIEDRTK